jgi:hypothetical protein
VIVFFGGDVCRSVFSPPARRPAAGSAAGSFALTLSCWKRLREERGTRLLRTTIQWAVAVGSIGVFGHPGGNLKIPFVDALILSATT